MVNERPQAANESKRIGKHLKKFFKFRQSSSPQPSTSTPGGDTSSALVSSGIQSINASLSTRQQDSLLTDKILISPYRSSHTNPVVIAIWIWIRSM